MQEGTPLHSALPHSPAGSVRAASGVHVPTLPTWLQDWHAPPQPPSQHTPSAHAPEMHCVPAVQGSPFSLSAVQLPEMQRLPARQSASLPQVATQAPAPSHTVAPQADSGSRPRGWLRHVPCEPATLHAWQLPPHAVLQQTPSTQAPETQALAALHPAPLASFKMQAPPEHQVPVLHCPSELQVFPHAAVLPEQK